MAETLDQVTSGLPLDKQGEIKACAAQLIEEEMTLRDLRKAHELTQTRMAEALHISQEASRALKRVAIFCFRRFAPISKQWEESCGLLPSSRIGGRSRSPALKVLAR
jgi:hypothetical protein